MSVTFESSSAGVLSDDALLECGVCWWLYDPADGDEIAGVVPGTPFSRLPEDYRCPCCEAPKTKFMLTEGGMAASPAAAETMAERLGALQAAYERAEESMLGLPVHNPKLEVALVGFRPFAEGYAGVVVTPWCMNVVVLPAASGAAPSGPLGSQYDRAFPSGGYRFTIGHLPGAGVVETCSLFSPMDVFTAQDVALEAAWAAAEGLFTEEEPEAAPHEEPRGPVSRRFLFTVGGHAR